MQKIIVFLKKGVPAICLCVAFASIGSMFFIPGSGLISCLPIITLCTVLPGLLVDKYYILPPLFFILTYFFTFSKDKLQLFPEIPGGFALGVSLYAAIISATACASVYIIKYVIENKKRIAINVCSSAALIILSVALVFPLNGTLWGYLDAKSEINAHINEKFFSNELNSGSIYHIPFINSYACDIYIEATCIPSVTYQNGIVDESVTKGIIEYIGAEKSVLLTDTLRKSFPNDSFNVKASSVSKKCGKISVDNREDIYPYIGYTVAINSEETAKSFVKKVKEYVSVINSSGFETNTVTFVGGAKQRLYYRIEVDIGSPHVSIDNLLEPYDTSIPYQS